MPAEAVVDQAKGLIQKRLAEIGEENARLSRALAELGGEKPSGRGPGRPRGSGKRSGSPRRKRTGTRAAQAVELIKGSPGISAADVAKRMKIKPNYLYRVLGDMEKEGLVKKQGRNYFPPESS